MSKKIQDAKKKCTRVQKELNKALMTLQDAETKVKSKEMELAQANSDLVNVMLVENNLTMDELPDLIAELAASKDNHSSSESDTSYLN